LWQAALASEPVRAVLASAQRPARRVLRFYGASESAVAQALAEAGGEDGGVEATVCAHQFEIWVELLVGEGAGARVDELAAALRARLGDHLFAEDDRPVEAMILDLCRIRGLTLAAAESCTGGLVAARLTSIPGSSDVFRGGVVAYANDAKVGLLGVPEELLARHGAVSREVCASMAAGAARHLDADVAVADTGIAGPGGGTPEKPVGRVYVGVWADGAPTTIELDLPGDRDAVRGRAATSALHLVRRVLTRNRDEAA
jgi:nicotinamide-nucleotide amidase